VVTLRSFQMPSAVPSLLTDQPALTRVFLVPLISASAPAPSRVV